MTKIIKLQAENIKRLKAVNIEPNGEPIVVIGGKNGQGKSSILDSIEYALGGKPKVTKPIREGETQARVVVETEEFIITRVFTNGGSRLEVQGKAGDLRHAIKSPQALLDRIVGNKLAFDPLAFSRMESTKQVDTLKELVGIDFTDLNNEREEVYESRTNVNRDIKNLKAQIEAIPSHNVPEKEISVSVLTVELQEKMNENSENDKNKRRLEETTENVRLLENKIKLIKAELADREHELAIEKETAEELSKAVESMIYHDLDDLRSQIDAAETTNSKIREMNHRRKLESQLEVAEQNSQGHTDRINEIDSTKREYLAKASFPVEGLAFDDTGVTFNDIPFSQCSSAEQLRVSVAMGLAMNPELKLLIIKDGSLLDSESLQMVKEMAAAADATIMIERVGDGEEVSIVIEDGSVKEVREKKIA